MTFIPFINILISFVMALLGMAFFTLLERKILGYAQLRKGPNKVGISGVPQPFADALKLLAKEQAKPSLSNFLPFLAAPILSLFLALTVWMLYPSSFPTHYFIFGTMFFLCVSSLNVYTTLAAGWSSNSKYSLLGALRSVAQTISYEVSMALILLSPLILICSFDVAFINLNQSSWIFFLLIPLFSTWFTTTLAETNRTPFDFAEGESELVSGFNTEYSSGSFALIFMAEYTNILMMSLLSAIFFMGSIQAPFLNNLFLLLKTTFLSFLFLWIRASFPRMRYDRLMNLTWKSFLPFSLGTLMILTPISFMLI
uniref:NADH-ubiquinone oxidoreductase chain 1 n=1 Tax=Halosydna sp. YZ-2018 TaxID=2153331 RepID=A0A343W6A1_9ANNE|nr:NADH dehydrogenase subunit 1 [Harmothoe imbricata]AVW86123.1 NADH dehydrogenase subunit 1 [Halosydna sp. YZ-2018]WKB17963.1 NADH dehydrogenase subunit 1 [Harmothoe imbricata]